MEDKIRINVLDGWHEVTIGQYMEISALSNDDPSDKLINIVSIMADEDPEIIRKLDINSINKIIKLISWIHTLPDDAVYKPIITIDGKEYGFISRLTELTIGDWIDLEHYLMDSNTHIHEIFAVLYRPLITAINDRDRILDNTESFEERAQLFKDKAMIGDVYGAFVFFSLIVNESTKTIQEYLIHMMTETEMTILKTKTKLVRRNAWLMICWLRRKLEAICGLGSSTIWQKAILQKWKVFLKQTLS